MEFRFERPKLRLGYVPNRRDSFADPAFLENKKAVDKVLKKLVKECDVMTGNCTFAEYTYEKKPVPTTQNAEVQVTKEDLSDMANRIMDSISKMLNGQKGDDGIRG